MSSQNQREENQIDSNAENAEWYGYTVAVGVFRMLCQRICVVIVALFIARPAAAQVFTPPTEPRMTLIPPPTAPRALPGSIVAASLKLPQPEKFQKIAVATLNIKRLTSWQVWNAGTVFRDFGNNAEDAADMFRTLRELRPTEWASIGTDRAIVDYGLTDGKTAPNAGFPKSHLQMDPRTTRAEQVRGVWCLRDDANILLNFGAHQADAEQALAVMQKYGFNRVGFIGKSTPPLAYFFAAPENTTGTAIVASPIIKAAQERAMNHTGLDVPGVGYVGEKIRIDYKKVEVRRDKGDFVVAYGPEILGRFGASEWTARDALKVIQDARFTEFCKFGTAGVTFFLIGEKAPKDVPFSVQGSRFAPGSLTVRPINGKWWLCGESSARLLLPAGSQEEGEQLVKLVKAYGFDQLCQIGTSSHSTMQFLAKGR